MIALTTQIGGSELGLSSKQDAQTSSVATFNGRDVAALPYGVFEKIFSGLDLQDLFNSRCVSQRWKEVIDDHKIVPRAFYRRYYPQKHSANPYTVERYHSSTKDWLNKFGDEGKKAITQLDQHLENKFFPQILFWSIAQVLGRTRAFCCESIFTIEHDSIVSNTCFSLDGKHLVTASYDHTAKIYGLNDGRWQKKATIKHDGWHGVQCLFQRRRKTPCDNLSQ